MRRRGCGYALMNRTVLSRLYPEPFRHLGVSALSGWFSDLRTALSAVAPENVVGPRAILLGPDPQRPGFVEASYLAAHLGYHLASSGDLITRGGRVWLRTLGGLEQIDVVFRRLADTGSDPLELGPAGTGGVTGLLQAVREGHVGVANSLGSGVADRLWLQPFLADAARHLLGETLELASIDTWWCGDSDRLAAVRADPEAFVFHDTDPVAAGGVRVRRSLLRRRDARLAGSHDGRAHTATSCNRRSSSPARRLPSMVSCATARRAFVCRPCGSATTSSSCRVATVVTSCPVNS